MSFIVFFFLFKIVVVSSYPFFLCAIFRINIVPSLSGTYEHIYEENLLIKISKSTFFILCSNIVLSFLPFFSLLSINEFTLSISSSVNALKSIVLVPSSFNKNNVLDVS